jgi:hypothetical protein
MAKWRDQQASPITSDNPMKIAIGTYAPKSSVMMSVPVSAAVKAPALHQGLEPAPCPRGVSCCNAAWLAQPVGLCKSAPLFMMRYYQL